VKHRSGGVESGMLRLVSITVLCVLLVPTVLPASGDSWIGRAGAGFAGEVASAAVLVGAFYAVDYGVPLDWNNDGQIGAVMMGFAALTPGIPAAMAWGVSMAGHAQGLDGRFWPSYLGAIVAFPLGAFVAGVGGILLDSVPYMGVPLLVVGAIIPAAGATIGYDQSRSKPKESGFLRERLIPPNFAVTHDRRVGRARTTRIDARLLAVRF
jgi:hypothetical protein